MEWGRPLWRLLLGVICTVTLCGLALADCPEMCTCKWKGGKQTVECINASLSSIPKVEGGTQVLDLGLNYFPALRTEIFKKHNLTNLQKIYLPQCSVRILEVHTFRGLTNLVDLDLSGNALASVPTSAVEDCKYLMRLSLRSNPISSVGSEALVGLSELVHLDLSHCGLEEVHPLAFRGLRNLEYLRLEANRLTTLSPTTQSFPPNLRDLTLHQNRWHCDCHLLALHNWLQNFTVPNSVEPRCHSPPRLISEPIKALAPTEFACIPKVSPTSMYLEVIEGKNMSLVCTIEAIPEANIWWMYKETEINNGSTLVNDIDMRQYYYVNSVGSTAWKRKSELFLSATSVDDNGTFSCIAGNKAGKAKAEFTLHVVVPMPPKPPQDVVEERFRTEYLIAIVVAVVLLLIISLVVTTLLAMRCQRSRAKRLHRGGSSASTSNAIESSELKRSRSGGDLSNTDTVATQITPATSYAGTSAEIVNLNPQVAESGENPDLLSQLRPLDDEIRLALLNKASLSNLRKLEEETPPQVPRRSTSYDIFSKPAMPKLSPPTPFADDSEDSFPHIIPNKKVVESKTLPRRSTAAVSEVLPPPPQYKGVHFAPQLEACKRRKSHEEIPSEGLPLGPAIPKAETVAIQVRNNPVPLLSSVKANPSGLSTSTFEVPNKNSIATSQKQVLGVRDKALKASAAGCEIVFVSSTDLPDHEIIQQKN